MRNSHEWYTDKDVNFCRHCGIKTDESSIEDANAKPCIFTIPEPAQITKMKLHTELNEAFSTLIKICGVLDIHVYREDLNKGRTFLSNIVNNSDLPSV